MDHNPRAANYGDKCKVNFDSLGSKMYYYEVEP